MSGMIDFRKSAFANLSQVGAFSIDINKQTRARLCRWLANHIDKRWCPRETEWERMRRIHEQGKRETEHTLGTLIFAYQARQRGWKAGVMPDFQEGRFAECVNGFGQLI